MIYDILWNSFQLSPSPFVSTLERYPTPPNLTCHSSPVCDVRDLIKWLHYLHWTPTLPYLTQFLVTHDIRDPILWSRHQFSPIVRPLTKELVFIAASPTTIPWRCVLDWAINSHAQEVNPIRFCSGFSSGSEATMDWKYCFNISHLRVRYWHTTAASGVWSRNQEERIIVQFSVLEKT